MRPLLLAMVLTGCLAARDPSDVLERCRQEARDLRYGEGGHSSEEALRAYDACVTRGGF